MVSTDCVQYSFSADWLQGVIGIWLLSLCSSLSGHIFAFLGCFLGLCTRAASNYLCSTVVHAQSTSLAGQSLQLRGGANARIRYDASVCFFFRRIMSQISADVTLAVCSIAVRAPRLCGFVTI